MQIVLIHSLGKILGHRKQFKIFSKTIWTIKELIGPSKSELRAVILKATFHVFTPQQALGTIYHIHPGCS